MRALSALALLVLGVIHSPLTLSQRGGAGEERWYQVELIVFAQGGGPQQGEEVWRTDIGLDYPLNWQELRDPEQMSAEDGEAQASDSAAASANGSPGEPIDGRAFVLLPDSEMTLLPELRRLNQNRSYRVLFEGAWLQSFAENRREPGVLIFGGEEYGDHRELEGSVHLYLRTYLHVETDLWLSQFAANFGQERPAWPSLPWPPNKAVASDRLFNFDDRGSGLLHQFDQGRSNEFEAILAQPYVTENIMLMQQERRMRSGEVHYIDHPKMGVLVKLTPYEMDAETQGEE